MNPAFRQILNRRIKFNLFLLQKLPSAFFSGLSIASFNDESCTVKVPYKWFTTNPFGSTYFACLAMAAEMSTGILALGNIYGIKPQLSMLVKSIDGRFMKKAKGITYFECTDGASIAAAIKDAVKEQEPQEVVAKSTGRDENGEVVAEFNITWGFKVRS